MTEYDKEVYQKGVAYLEEWEDINYCEHNFKFKDEWLTDKEVVDLLDEQEERIKELEQEKELIKDKLLKYILNYKKVGNDNWNLGLRESVETMQEEMKELFKNPRGWEYMFSCDDCIHFKAEEDNYVDAYCSKFKKEIDYFKLSDCKEFEWK